MSDWYIEPSSSGAQSFDPPAPALLAEGELRVARWTVAITAPRFDVLISTPEE